MAYEQATVDSFKKKLKNDGYDNLTAAKRAIGKIASLTEADKAKATKAAINHFGEPSAKPAAKTVKSAKKSAKKASKK